MIVVSQKRLPKTSILKVFMNEVNEAEALVRLLFQVLALGKPKKV